MQFARLRWHLPLLVFLLILVNTPHQSLKSEAKCNSAVIDTVN